jgi:hypothetical protein
MRLRTKTGIAGLAAGPAVRATISAGVAGRGDPDPKGAADPPHFSPGRARKLCLFADSRYNIDQKTARTAERVQGHHNVKGPR